MKFWHLFSAILFVFLLLGCDVEQLEYEDDETYALFDHPRPAMSPPSPAEIDQALATIRSGEPEGDIPWAYSTILDFLGVTIGPEQISNAMFTVQETEDMLFDIAVDECQLTPGFVEQLLRIAIARYNEPDFQARDPLENVALAALAGSLESGSFGRFRITAPAQINGNVLLTEGDLFIILLAIYQSPDPEVYTNILASIVNNMFRNGYYLALGPHHISEVRAFRENYTEHTVLSTSPQVDDRRWHFVAATLGNGQVLKIYIDGAMVEQRVTEKTARISPNDAPIRIGIDITGAREYQYVGIIDEVAIFNRELSESEIQRIYEEGVTTPFRDASLILYLPLNESAGDTAGDASVYENNGKVMGDGPFQWIQWIEEGDRIRRGIQLFHGSYVEVPEIPVYDVDNALSLMAWVNSPLITSDPTVSARLIDKSDWGTCFQAVDKLLPAPTPPHQGELVIE